MKKIFALIVLLISVAAIAGPVVIGNGGNAIKIDDNYYLLDLAEQGIAEEPHFSDSSSRFFFQYFRSRTMASPNRLPADTLDLFSQKMAEIADLDPVYAEALMTGFENVRWMFINYRLNDIPVDSIIAGPYYQVAARTNDVILIDTLYWQQMNLANRVALLFHELNYIVIYPKKDAGSPTLTKSPLKARLQTGYLFTENLEHINPVEFSNRIRYYFPSRFAAQLDQLAFYPFVYKLNNGSERMAFNPFIRINGTIEGQRLAKLTKKTFIDSLCVNKPFDLKTADIVGIVVKQDVFNGDNNSQDVTTYEDTTIPGYIFTRENDENCTAAAERLFQEINLKLPGLF